MDRQGWLYSALYRLEHKGWIDSTWVASEDNRKAKCYHITTAGSNQLRSETAQWSRLTGAFDTVLKAMPEES